MKNNKTQLLRPLDLKLKPVKKPRRKLQIHDFIYCLLCILIIIGFYDNVERFVQSSVTPRIVEAQVRFNNAKRALLNQPIVVQANAQQVVIPEIKNPFDPRSPMGFGWEINKKMFGIEQWGAFEELITHESGWNPYAVNDSSGACGIGQALPCSKMKCEKWDYECQVQWTADYIKDRYGDPIKAWDFWQTKHLINGEWVNYY